MMNKKMASSILPVLAIFLSWFLVIYYCNEPDRLPNNKDIIIPFIWACLFIYLHGKSHIYIAINSYVIFLLMLFADILNFGGVVGATQISYLLISLFAVFSFIFIYQDLFAKKPRAASIFSFFVTIALYSVPVFYISYAINFNATISREVFYAILQTDLNEALEFSIDYISPIWIGVVLFLAFFVGYLLLKQEKKETLQIERSLLIFMVVIFLTLSYTNRDDIRLYAFTKNTITEYWDELALFHKIQTKLKNNKIQFEAQKLETEETYLVVIGESLNKRHMGIYGYIRNTTPLLNKELEYNGLLIFNNVFSSHTHTMPVLSQSLTEANQHNKKDYYDSLSIVNILNKADIETFWITNQVLYGAWDNLVSVIANQSDHLISLNQTMGKRTETQVYDGAVLKEVKNILSKDSKNNRVIFVHLMGNHGNYCLRYPIEYNMFSGDLKIGIFGNLSEINYDDKINCYDNSVLYNDFVVSSLINSLKQENTINALLYFSDHADDVMGKLGHNATNFTYSMTQIPFIIWLSDKYKQKYQDKYNILKSNNNALFSNDDVYDTLIGIFNINTDRYQAVNDLSSSQYFLDENKAYTLNGKVPYTDKANYLYHQKNNIAGLLKSSNTLRILPHRVNSIGKLNDVWHDGYRAFEIDIHYSDDNSSHFEVGHSNGHMSGFTLEKFITSIRYTDLDKVLVDLKNLTINNHNKALERLNYLDGQFKLKEKFIIESEITDSFLKKFSDNGWHISYYLPTDKIAKLIVKNNINEMKRLAKVIHQQSLTQDLSAISFEHRLYPFVKDYLEPLLGKNIVYHTQDLSVKLYDSNLLTNLSKKDYFADDRVKTILSSYKSPFSL